MRSGKVRTAFHKASLVLIVMAASLLITPLPASAAESKPVLPAPSFRIKLYHVHYAVSPDGTYTELDETQSTVLNSDGLRFSQRMPIGGPHGLMPPIYGTSELEVLAAYTLKKNGQKIPAAPIQPPGQFGIASSVQMAVPRAEMNVKWMAFPNAEIGDILVVSYKITNKNPLLPNSLILDQVFPPFFAYDDVEVTLEAPASMHLRFNAVGMAQGKKVSNSTNQKWVWKYQSRAAGSPPQLSGGLPGVHISTFENRVAEMQAINGQAGKALPLPTRAENQRCMVIQGMSNDGPQAMNIYTGDVAEFFWGDARYLEQWSNDWNTPSCVFDDGRPRLSAFSSGYSLAFRNQNDWSKSYARIQELKKAHPGKAFIALAEASYWNAYAWDARGGGYASTVTPDGWQLFHERLGKAEQVLLDSKAYASALPPWYDDMLAVQTTLDRSPEQKMRTFLEGAKRFKTYYPLYFTMLNFLTPKWGGSWEQVDKFVAWSVENTKDVDGTTMYARLYWVAYQSLRPEEKLFRDTRASWPKMKKGFEDMMARHPKSKWNLNNFAKFACVAGDKTTFSALRRQIGNDVMEEAWPGPETLDLCEAKYGT